MTPSPEGRPEGMAAPETCGVCGEDGCGARWDDPMGAASPGEYEEAMIRHWRLGYERLAVVEREATASRACIEYDPPIEPAQIVARLRRIVENHNKQCGDFVTQRNSAWQRAIEIGKAKKAAESRARNAAEDAARVCDDLAAGAGDSNRSGSRAAYEHAARTIRSLAAAPSGDTAEVLNTPLEDAVERLAKEFAEAARERRADAKRERKRSEVADAAFHDGGADALTFAAGQCRKLLAGKLAVTGATHAPSGDARCDCCGRGPDECPMVSGASATCAGGDCACFRPVPSGDAKGTTK